VIAVLAVTGGRDGWDWLLYGLSVVTAVVAIVGFAYWILEQRRRPEVGFNWLFAETGERSGLVDWPPETVQELRAGETVLVEIVVFNAGDRAGTNARWNFVADESVRLEWQGNEAAHRLVSFNDRQALGPSPQTAFFAGSEPWPPGDWFVKFFRLTYEPQHPHTEPLAGRLVLELADDRLNARGHRWLPTLVVRRDTTWPPATSPWPERHRRRHRLSWAVAQPRGHVACRAGVRLDARDILLVPNDTDHERSSEKPTRT
jgi:hypothetical protein